MDHKENRLLARVGLLVGLVGVVLAFIAGGKLIAGKPVGAGLYICMIVCLSVGFLMLLRSQAQSKAGE
jgi:hypothetical protein